MLLLKLALFALINPTVIWARMNPAGAGYVGSGYNVLSGNPDGSHFTSGGPDPGLLPTKLILQKNLRELNGYCPEESICTEVAYDVTDDQFSLVTDLQQYQRLYTTAWDFDTDQTALPVESTYAGTLSNAVAEAKDILETAKDVILDKRKLTTLSEVRFNYRENRKLTSEFVLDLCELPLTYKSEVYRRFFAKWGTHVVVAVKMGQLAITRYKIPFQLLNNLLLNAPSLTKLTKLSTSTSIVSYNSSDFQDVGVVQTILDFAVKYGGEIRSWHFSTGSPVSPAPVHLVLRRLDFFITQDFLESSPDLQCPQLSLPTVIKQLHSNFRRGLFEYPLVSAAPMLFPFTRFFRLSWPRGTYALLKNMECPNSGPSRTWYGPGTLVLHDDLRMYVETLSSGEFDMDLNPNGELSLKFCVKLADSSRGSFDWPSGSYCIFKKNECPFGFVVGSMGTVAAKITLASDALPDGEFDGTAHTLDFCCRHDRTVDQPIMLPSSQPFTLLSTVGQCQKVQGMTSDLRIQSFRRGNLYGDHPFITSTDRDTMRLHLCYYKPWTENPF